MKYNHEAIYNVYPQVTSIDDGDGVFDKSDPANPIEVIIDPVLVQTETDRLNAIYLKKKQDREDKYNGFLFEGVMCSAKSEDMWGLNAVQDEVLSGADVYFEFSNGNKLLLTTVNAAAFTTAWKTFRKQFFPTP